MAEVPARNTSLVVAGLGLIGVSLLVLLGLGFWIAGRSGIGSEITEEALIYIDAQGRIALDNTLQVDGPAPVPVSAGIHKLTFFDISAEPVEIAAEAGQFVYVPDPTADHFHRPDANRGVLEVSAFPPDTMIEIPDCTPVDSRFPVTCTGRHTLTASLSPGTYTIRYSNPYLGDFEEAFTIGGDATVERQHSYISTVSEWNEWRSQHGQVIERQYGRRSRSYGAGGAILLPLEAAGDLLGELFD